MTNHAENKRKQRDKKRLEGYVLKQIWVKPEWWGKVFKLLKRLDK